MLNPRASLFIAGLGAVVAASSPLQPPPNTNIAAFPATAATSALQGPDPARLGAPTALAGDCLHQAEACQTEAELEAWRAAQENQVLKIPAAWRHFAANGLDREFQRYRAKLRGETASATVGMDVGVDRNAGQQPPMHTSGSQLAGVAPTLLVQERSREERQTPSAFQHCAGLVQPAQLNGKSFQVPILLATAQMCPGEPELRAWRACQLAEVQEKVPADYQRFAVEHVKKQFEDRLSELHNGIVADSKEAAGLPVLLQVAEECRGERELRAWREHQLTQIKQYVTPQYHAMATEAIERFFAQRLQGLRVRHSQEVRARHPPSHTLSGTPVDVVRAEEQSLAAASVDDADSSPRLGARLLLLVLAGLAAPAFISGTISVLRSVHSKPSSTQLPQQKRFHEEDGHEFGESYLQLE